MKMYEDDLIELDHEAVTIKQGRRGNRTRRIPYSDIRGAEQFPLRLGTGRYRLVGISPLRPRDYFYWGRGRHAKTHGISLDVGRFMRIAITPDDPQAVMSILDERAVKTQDTGA